MAARTVTRNNIIAGIFVLAAAVLAVFISIAVSGAQERLKARTRYYVRFSLEQGARGIKSGSAVTLGGQPVGRVVRVDFVYSPAPENRPVAVDVLVAIDRNLSLYEDAIVFLERPLLGNIGAINIAGVGDGTQVAQFQNNSPLLQEGEILQGAIAPPAFLAQAGFGPDQARQFRMMFSQASETVDRITRMTADVEAQLNPAISTARAAIDDVKEMTTSFREKTPEWQGRVDNVLTKANDAADRLPAVIDSIEKTIADADAVALDLREAIAENRPELDRVMANLDEAMARINGESVGLVNEALGEFAQSGKTFNTFLREQAPVMRRTIGNLRLAADQIKLAGIEVRRNPWRLLYIPKLKELDSEVFYDAARTYAQAVSDLRAASESLESVSAADPASTDPETLQQIHEHLQEAFRRYQGAEQILLDQMIQKRP